MTRGDAGLDAELRAAALGVVRAWELWDYTRREDQDAHGNLTSAVAFRRRAQVREYYQSYQRAFALLRALVYRMEGL